MYYELKTAKELNDERKKLKKSKPKNETDETAAKSKQKTTDETYTGKEDKEEEVYVSDTKDKRLSKLPCDCYYELGELLFCFRDVASAQIRSTLPLPEVSIRNC